DRAPDQTSNLKPQTSYDRFRGRIMFPICNDVGEVIAFIGRLLENEAESAKYINSPETPLFRKGNVLFGLHKTKRGLIEANCAIVCEGQLDLITLYEAGITNVVAPQGTAFTENQARLLKRFVDEVVLCFDADAAGNKAAARKLAGTVSRVHDPMMRGEIVSKVSARLGVPTSDFENLVPRSVPRPMAELPRDMDSIAPSQTIKQLSVLALRDSEVRDFLLAQ